MTKKIQEQNLNFLYARSKRMIVKDNDCVGCETCMGCGRRYGYYYHVCDRCESSEQLYIWDGEELCAECILNGLEKVDMEEQ